MKARAWSSVVGGALCLALFGGCSAGSDKGGEVKPPTGTGANGSGGSVGNIGGLDGIGNNTSLGGDLNNAGGSGGAPMGCQNGMANFVPKVPTVMLVVDRSGTMFKDAGNPWNLLRDGALSVVKDMEKDVRFGLLAVTGEAQAGMCPLLDEVAPADNNYDALAAKYMSLAAPLKGESPGMRGLQRAADVLAADPTEGDKYILFVTDGEQDYCNDGDFACPTDSVVYHLQQIAAKGIKTFIFGLPMASTDAQQQARYPAVLQAFADAGMGVAVAPVLPPPGDQGPIQIFYNCQGVPEWKAETVEAGTAMNMPLGTYGTASGGAKVFTPGVTEGALRDEIAKVLAGVKTCTFDIAGDIKVDLTRLSAANVYVEGEAVTLDETGMNGWHMPNASQIELVGAACENWRKPENTEITWNFPCEIIVPK
jgi:hypothetical protein